jgi:KaiC/GvpD/RAD55 family RecA-like ATPase
LSEGEPCLAIITDCSPDIAVENFRFLGFDISDYVKKGLLRFVDCYSGHANLTSSSPYVVDPANVTDLSITIEQAKKGLDKVCIVLDSITTLALDAGLNTTRDFMQVLMARMRQARCLSLCALDLGVLEETFVNFLRSYFDGVLEMKFEETEKGEMSRFLRIFSIKMAKYSTRWTKIEIVERGILVSTTYLP